MVLPFITNCASNKEDSSLKKVLYNSEFPTSSANGSFEKRNFEMYIPKGYNLIDEDYNPEFKEVVYEYEQGSIYITDNNLAGSPLNGDNKRANDISIVKRLSLTDSVYMNGKNNDLYWKENILNDIVVGYFNVSNENKKVFDEALSSIKRR